MSKRIAPKRGTGKRIQVGKIDFLPDESVHVGLDVHKRTYSVTLWSEQRGSIVSR